MNEAESGMSHPPEAVVEWMRVGLDHTRAVFGPDSMPMAGAWNLFEFLCQPAEAWAARVPAEQETPNQ